MFLYMYRGILGLFFREFMTANPLESLNMKYLQPYAMGGSVPAINTLSPADMGMGLFNMPVIPQANLNTNNIFGNNGQTIPLPNGNNISGSFDFGAAFMQAMKLQNAYMENMKKMMALTFNNSILKNTGNIINNTSNADYGNYNFDVTQKFNGTAAELDKNLKGVMTGKGAKLIELQNKYGINAAFLAALVNSESSHGTSSAARNKNNVAGIMSAQSGYKEQAEFNSVDDCLEALAKNLKNNYVGKGLTTISQIHQKYCPIGASNDPTGLNKNWGPTISQLTNKYQVA